MKSAKKVRVPRNKKITPKRKKMRSKPRKQSKKRKHRGGIIGEPCNPMESGSCNDDSEWCKPLNYGNIKRLWTDKNKGICEERVSIKVDEENRKYGNTLTDNDKIKLRKRFTKYNNEIKDKTNLNYSNCDLGYLDEKRTKKFLNQMLDRRSGNPICQLINP